jgi:hypothetical protein
MNLSEHLSLIEVTKSDTAKRLGISNTPTEAHLENLKMLADRIFEPIREHFGVPIHISSGYRSAELNKATAGSSATSQHCLGQALDLDQDGFNTGVSNADVFNFIHKNLNYDQLIWEYGTDKNPDWVHVSYSPSGKQRKSTLRCTRVNGVPHYTAY